MDRLHLPFRLFGNTYHVRPHGPSAILVTSPAGHILIDAALPESAPAIAANIRHLGFEPEDIRLIVHGRPFASGSRGNAI